MNPPRYAKEKEADMKNIVTIDVDSVKYIMYLLYNHTLRSSSSLRLRQMQRSWRPPWFAAALWRYRSSSRAQWRSAIGLEPLGHWKIIGDHKGEHDGNIWERMNFNEQKMLETHRCWMILLNQSSRCFRWTLLNLLIDGDDWFVPVPDIESCN